MRTATTAYMMSPPLPLLELEEGDASAWGVGEAVGIAEVEGGATGDRVDVDRVG